MAILFSISLGFNNSSGANDLPKSIENCTIDLDSLDVVSVRRSINIVDSVFLTLCVVAVVYTLFICLMKTINPEILEEKWKIFNTMVSYTKLFVFNRNCKKIMQWTSYKELPPKMGHHL